MAGDELGKGQQLVGWAAEAVPAAYAGLFQIAGRGVDPAPAASITTMALPAASPVTITQ